MYNNLDEQALIADEQLVTSDTILDELNTLRSLVPEVEELSTKYQNLNRLQEALFTIAELSGRNLELNDFYRGLHNIMANLLYAENFYIGLKDSDGNLSIVYLADRYDDGKHLAISSKQLELSMTGYLMRRQEPVLASRSQFTELVESGEIMQMGSVPSFLLGAPMMSDTECMGVVVVQSYDDSKAYDTQDMQVLEFVAHHLAQSIERAHYRDSLEKQVELRTAELTQTNDELHKEVQERQRSEQLQRALFDISEMAHNAEHMDDFYSALHQVISKLIICNNFYVAILDQDGETLLFPYRVDQFDAPPKPRKLGRGMTEYLMTKAHGMLLSQSDIRALEQAKVIEKMGTPAHSWLGVPLKDGAHVIGAIVLQSYDLSHQYSQSDLELINFVSRHVASALMRKQAQDKLENQVRLRTKELESEITERRRIERQLKHDASHDSLTGLPNRIVFLQRLREAFVRAENYRHYDFAVLFLDLDRFKLVNDSLGHMSGDELLKKASSRIRRCLRGRDLIARLGGDEFAILLEPMKSEQDAIGLAQRISASFDQPFFVNGERIFTGTSVGIALGHDRYVEPEELLRDADAAMYRAKAQGRRRYVLFDASMHEEATRALKLENKLRIAIDRNQFEVYYQPILSGVDRKPTAIEALVRWRHPVDGLVMPGQFIELATEIGFIKEIDWYVLNRACYQLAEWRQNHPELNDLSVTVNLASQHFSQASLPSQIANVLEVTELPASALRLEITEHALLEDQDKVQTVLSQLNELGVQLLMDDFGTGYSSLAYLHRFPIHGVKIDRSFVTNMRHQDEHMAIVRTVKALADNLQLKLVAEGIEDEETMVLLEELGCDYLQGFHIQRPINRRVTLDWLLENSK
ncbi:bifunctional diguanylate cyclase/phosphodiesterase [Neiella marina]|uniref:Bifunctional diguanylate cyclase/phosphodiesterase n=1 Tax=Neiella marina TaxID=508461 RepID=A0A8J2U2Q2_9GAMM|nr:EAL domain-containing protein [Neiella marina]GGA67492.1 bifunctional diguanylate cyclase/phosphodiesterase [Neiella marina]